MKLFSYLFCLLSILLVSCNPKVSSWIDGDKLYPPLSDDKEVIVFSLNQQMPQPAQKIGRVKIGDTGFTSNGNCTYSVVAYKAKQEARKAGGNAIKITKHKLPNIWTSGCHRIEAEILRLDQPDIYKSEEPEDIIEDLDYAILKIYRSAGIGPLVSFKLSLGDTELCRVKNNFKTTIHVKDEGTYMLSARTETKSEVPIEIIHGKTYYIRCRVEMGITVGRPIIEIVDSQYGEIEFNSIKD